MKKGILYIHGTLFVRINPNNYEIQCTMKYYYEMLTITVTILSIDNFFVLVLFTRDSIWEDKEIKDKSLPMRFIT